jgi:hypothetical protein
MGRLRALGVPAFAMLAVLGIVGSLVILAGSATGQALRFGGPAPDVSGGPWIGSAPLTIAGLRGRVVLVEFWTHG